MKGIYYLKGNVNKCLHEQTQEGAINLKKVEETSDRPDLCWVGRGPPRTRLQDPYFCGRKQPEKTSCTERIS